MTKVMGAMMMAAGCLCWGAAFELTVWAECTPSEPVSPARCNPAGEDPLEENPEFPNCQLESLGTECKPVEGSVCGSFNGYGQPRTGECIFHLEGSNVLQCIEGADSIEVELHYWVGGCGFDEESDCHCLFTQSSSIPPASVNLCNCEHSQE